MLYVGHGAVLKVYEWRHNKLLWEKKILSRNKIHGILVLSDETLAFWGARSLAIMDLSTGKSEEVTLPDWIISVNAAEGTTQLVALTAHNDLLHVSPSQTANGFSLSITKRVSSKEQSILYSGTIYMSPCGSQILVGAGTVLHGVVVWNGESGEIVQRMTSHEGSIFGVAFSPDATYVASCSDDRSIRVFETSSGNQRWMGWGHLARIWQLQFIQYKGETRLLSASEDCTARIWAFDESSNDLKCEQIFEGHISKNVWSTDFLEYQSEETNKSTMIIRVIATGGGDGALRLWDVDAKSELEGSKVCLQVQEFGSPGTNAKKGRDTELFKDYTLVANGNLLVVATSKGRVFACDIPTRKWTLLAQLEDTYPIVSKASFCPKDNRVYIIAKCLSQKCLVGYVDCDEGSRSNLTLETIKLRSPLKGKLEFVPCSGTPQSEKNFLIQHLATNLLMLVSQTGSALQFQCPNNFILTAAHYDSRSSKLYVGSRHGALAIYNVDWTPLMAETTNSSTGQSLPIHADVCIRKLLSEDAITSIDAQGGIVFVASRTGNFGEYLIKADGNLKLLEVNKVSRGTIEGTSFSGSSHILYGFRTDQFYMWDAKSNTELFSERCGGGHRIWNICFEEQQRYGAFTLAYTKASEINIVRGTLFSPKMDSAFLQPSLHGREVRAACFNPHNNNIIATGGEDTLIKLNKVVTEKDEDKETNRPMLVVSNTYGCHVSGIQSITWAPGGDYLLTTSAREELFIWRVIQTPQLHASVEYVLPVSSMNPDLRIMDVALTQSCLNSNAYLLTTIYSDSTIKLWDLVLNEGEIRAKLLDETKYTHCCLLTCEFVKLDERVLLLTSHTDGYVALWGVKQSALSKAPLCKIQSHQSGVKSGIIRVFDDETQTKVLFISGGDDNALSAIEFMVKGDSIAATKLGSVDSAHACTITSLSEVVSSDICKKSVQFISVSTDQQIKRWTWAPGNGFTMDEAKYTSVADTGVSAINTNNLLFVGGSGASLWQI